MKRKYKFETFERELQKKELKNPKRQNKTVILKRNPKKISIKIRRVDIFLKKNKKPD